MTVYPFILNGIKLVGISAQNTPREIRKKVWNKFRNEFRVELPDIIRVISLEELPLALETVMGKKNRGQLVLKHA